MTRIAGLLIGFTMAAAWNGAAAEEHRPAVQVVIRPPQSVLHGPDDHIDHGGVFDYTLLGQMTNTLAGAGLGVLTDTALLINDRSSETRFRSSTTMQFAEFDFRELVVGNFGIVATNDDWGDYDVETYDWADARSSLARSVFRSSDVDYVLFVDTDFRLTPGLDQLRIVYRTAVYKQPAKGRRYRAIVTRDFEYLSPSRGSLFRPFADGEKEKIVAAIEGEYAQKLARFPHNEKAYRKDRDDMLRMLRNRDVVLPLMALSEGWPDNSLRVALLDGTEHLMRVIRDDVGPLRRTIPVQGETLAFATLARDGNRMTQDGWVLGQRDGNTLYCNEDGHVYSLPAASAAVH